MSLSGKRDGFVRGDLIAFAGVGGVKKTKAAAIMAQVSEAVAGWHRYAEQARLPGTDIARIARAHRTDLFV